MNIFTKEARNRKYYRNLTDFNKEKSVNQTVRLNQVINNPNSVDMNKSSSSHRFNESEKLLNYSHQFNNVTDLTSKISSKRKNFKEKIKSKTKLSQRLKQMVELYFDFYLLIFLIQETTLKLKKSEKLFKKSEDQRVKPQIYNAELNSPTALKRKIHFTNTIFSKQAKY